LTLLWVLPALPRNFLDNTLTLKESRSVSERLLALSLLHHDHRSSRISIWFSQITSYKSANNRRRSEQECITYCLI
jgi:hypothetical protein